MLKKVSKHQMDYVQNNCSWLLIQNNRSITGDRDPKRPRTSEAFNKVQGNKLSHALSHEW